MTEIKIPDDLIGKEYIQMAFDRCIKCSTCKYGFKNYEPSCPSGEKFLFESYWASGRIRLIRGLINGDLEWNDDLKDAIFACTTCGHCMDSCQAPHADFIVDMIEALRELAVKNIGPGVNQDKLIERACNPKMWNPYGEDNSDNSALKEEYGLSDKAEYVYWIGCTSNYRQTQIRDATLRLLKKAGVDFTLIDEHCCSSPMLRTGQLKEAPDFMKHNVEQISNTGAKKVVTSCAGCYRTLLKDYEKFGIEIGFEVIHTAELIKQLLEEKKIKIKSKYDKVITYHDPCHLGRHMDIYEIPRDVIKQIPGIQLVEMTRNRNHAWCCGAGGGVKISYPDWSVEISKDRLEQAKETGAAVITSTCPFCKTNLSDANEKFKMGFEVLDLIEILDELEIEVKSTAESV
jgi:heterodisulfide reductase subunit D